MRYEVLVKRGRKVIERHQQDADVTAKHLCFSAQEQDYEFVINLLLTRSVYPGIMTTSKGKQIMQINDIIARLHDAAAASTNDAVANSITDLANRLAHQGAPFEEPLSETEMTLISKYAGL